LFFQSLLCGVGKTPPAPAEVRGANGGSGYKTPPRVIPDSGQVSKDNGDVRVGSINETCHVLQQADSRSYHANALGEFRPEVTRIACSKASSRNAMGLAGESCGKDVNHALIASGVPFAEESAEIAEDGSGVKEPIFDALRDELLDVRLIVYIPHGSDFQAGDSKPK
jgi:hypothetical protein